MIDDHCYNSDDDMPEGGYGIFWIYVIVLILTLILS